DDLPIFILYTFIIGTSLSIFFILTTSDDQPPKFYSILSFMRFGVAIALGLIIGLSDAIFAMQNITIAKTRCPMMAIIHNVDILLGIGLSGTYVTTKTRVHYKISVEPTLFCIISYPTT
ncbi:6287_t:CDS:2, partial [Scutellospora calospora]